MRTIIIFVVCTIAWILLSQGQYVITIEHYFASFAIMVAMWASLGVCFDADLDAHFYGGE
jgi:hypothetical protein